MVDENDVSFQDRVIGEKAALGVTFPDDEEGVERYRDIDDMLNEDDHVVGNLSMSKEELIAWLTPNDHHRTYPVVGSSKLINGRVGEVQGWVSAYSTLEESDRAQRGIEAPLPSDLKVMEVSYARHPDAEGGQISSGLRGVILKILRANPNLVQPVIETDEQGRDVIVGYRINMMITAFTDPDNINSELVLEHAGFKKQEKNVWWNPDDKEQPGKEENHFWVLDWNWLLENSIDRSKSEIADLYNVDLSKSTLVPVLPQFEGQVMSV